MTHSPPEPPPTDDGGPADPRIEEIAEKFWDRLRQGERPDRKALAAAHPEISDDLEERLALVELMFDAGREPDRPGAFRGEETVPLAESPPRSASLERPDSARLPDQIGPYKILKILGEGGMGVVYLAVDSKLGRNVAIKMVADEFSDDPDRLALLEREARTAAHLNHPNIATVYELGEFDGSYFIAMEYLEGRTLSKLLHRPQPISLPEFLDIAVQIAHGLTAAHGNKVIHRDLKPANVMITNEGRVKILDFGLAKALQTEAAAATWLGAPGGSTGMSAGFGTPGYSSPEQCRGERVDVRCDLFSFGVVLYQMATGVAPFERPDLPSTISAVVNEEPPPPAVVNSDLPSGLGDLIAKLMAKRPEDRYQSSAEVLADLEEIERQVKEGRGRRTAFMVVLGAAVVLLAIVLVMRPPPKPALAGDFESLVIYLADGRFPEAEELVVNIKALDQGGPRSEKAQELLDEALTLQIWTDDLDQAIQDNLAADSLVEAWKGIERLSKKRFKDDDFKPATERAIELTLKLVGKLEFESREVLESQPGFPISRLEPIITLLEKVAPENNYLRDLRASVAHSHLQQLHDKARPGMTPVDLRDIIRQMDKIDRSSALTATVWLMHEIRRQQTTSFEEGLKEFKEASLVGLATAIEGHERAWNESPSSEAKQELDQLEAALGWLSKYHTALDTVDHDLEEARRLHNALNPETLSWAFREFQNMAHGHRNSLFDRVQDGTARALCRQIEYYCDRRELVEARAALDDLDSRPVPRRVHSEIGDARGRVKRLANEENKRRQFEDKFNRFLEDLRGHMGADAKLSLDLDVLEHAWRTERDRLDTAIEIEPRDELLKRRSTLNLRLGNYGKALKDAQQSLDLQPSPEGFLLSAQARFAQAHGDPEALEDARQSIRLDNQSAPPVYLRGFYRYEKFEAGDSKDTDLLDKAREDLDAVVDTHRLDSAHAYYFLAKIYFELASIALDAKKPNVAIVSADKVIALANRALSAPLTEQEIIVAFGGYKAAVDPGVIKSFQRNIFVVRAEGHLIRKDFQEGIADFDRAISLDEGFADTYFSRALAKGKAGHYADAMLDLAEAEKHAGNDTRLKRLIPKWRKDYKTRLDKGQQ